MKKTQTLPWPRVLSSIVGVTVAVVVGDLIREGTMSYSHALHIVAESIVVAAILWGGAALWQKSKS